MSLPLTPDREMNFRIDLDTDSFLIPKVKKDLASLFVDDDSGLGMDEDDQERTALTRSPLNFAGRLNFGTSPEQDCNNGPTNYQVYSGSLNRKRKLDDDEPSPAAKLPKHHALKRSLSFDDKPRDESSDVMTAVDRLVEEEDLTGDGNNTFCLPTVRGKHSDLKSIDSHTMAQVLRGEYDDVIGSFRVIDCRYPYEYNGGHISGAENLDTHEQVLELLHSHRPAEENGKRNILIFHCEFSSERGPKMSRYLRAKDREANSHQYPSLSFPEVYLLDGGYKSFFLTEDNRILCQPMDYVPMIHHEHETELRHFRSRSKSWTAGDRKKKTMRRRF